MGDFDVDRRFADIAHLVAGWEFEAARDRVQELLDRDDLTETQALNARLVLAEILRELGDLTAAYDLAEVVAGGCERVHGPDHPRTVHALALLGMVRHDFDELDDAEAIYRRVLTSAADVRDDPESARAVRLVRANLALLHRDRGERALALDLLNAAYLAHRREYGAEDLDTVRIAAELAGMHRDDGDLGAARRLFTIAHAAARSRLGDRHPVTRAMEWELAAVDSAPPDASAPTLDQTGLLRVDNPRGPTGRRPIPSLAADGAAAAQPEWRAPGSSSEERQDTTGPDEVASSNGEPYPAGEPLRPGAASADARSTSGDQSRPHGGTRPDGRALDDEAVPDSRSALGVGSGPDGRSALEGGTGQDGRSGPRGRSESDGQSSPDDPPGRSPDRGSLPDVPSQAGGPRWSVGIAPLAGAVRRVPARVLLAVASAVLLAVAVAPLRPDQPVERATPSGTRGPASVAASAPTTTPAPATGRPLPTESLRVHLRDEGTALAVSWTDAGASVVIALSRAGAPAVVLASLPPETTEYVVRGVEPGVEYCVVVGPLNETEAVSRATSVCTGRLPS